MMNLLNFLFWAILVFYVIHIMDEMVLGGGFVAKIKEHWWPEYNGRMFFWFNTVLLILMAICIIINENFGGHWVILPLFWAFERAIHGVTLHIWWKLRHKEYSPGLLSSNSVLDTTVFNQQARLCCRVDFRF